MVLKQDEEKELFEYKLEDIIKTKDVGIKNDNSLKDKSTYNLSLKMSDKTDNSNNQRSFYSINKNWNEMSFKNREDMINASNVVKTESSYSRSNNSVNRTKLSDVEEELAYINPLSDYNTKCEILKEINIIQCREYNFKQLSQHSMNTLLNFTIKKLKTLNNNCTLTKEYLLSHKKDICGIVKSRYKQIKKKKKFNTKVAHTLISNRTAIEEIENRDFKTIEESIRRKRDDYEEKRKRSKSYIKEVKSIFEKILRLEKQHIAKEVSQIEEVNNIFLVSRIDKIQSRKETYEKEIKSFRQYIIREKHLMEKYSHLRLEI
jgi:hypothetical protein